MKIIQCTIHTRDIEPGTPALVMTGIHALHTLSLEILTYHHAPECALELMRAGRSVAGLTTAATAPDQISDLYPRLQFLTDQDREIHAETLAGPSVAFQITRPRVIKEAAPGETDTVIGTTTILQTVAERSPRGAQTLRSNKGSRHQVVLQMGHLSLGSVRIYLSTSFHVAPSTGGEHR
jgi:hypothetical protein